MTELATLQTGLELHRMGRFDGADEAYRRAIENYHGSADAWHLWGVLASERGLHADAEQRLRKAVQIRPRVAPFWRSLGVELQSQGRWEEAQECLRKAIGLDPRRASYRADLAEAFHAAGDPRQAMNEYHAALEIEPSNAAILNNLGNCLRDLGLREYAANCLQEAIRLSPHAAESWLNLGNVYRDMAKLDMWEGCSRTATELRPMMPEAWNNLAAALLRLGKVHEAKAACEKALSLDGKLWSAWVNLSAILLDLRCEAEAIKAARRALELQPGSEEGHRNLGAALAAMGLWSQAALAYVGALRVKPAASAAWIGLGEVQTALNQPAEARVCFNRALQISVESPHALLGLGRVEWIEGNMVEAQSYFDQALRSAPQMPEAHLCRAIVLLSQENYEEGWQEYEWRYSLQARRTQSPTGRRWAGAAIEGGLLVRAEQGLGDSIQFIRFLRHARARCSALYFACPPELTGILQGCAGVDQLVPFGSPIPDYEAEVDLLSLPGLLPDAMSGEACPAPYLSRPATSGRWREELRSWPGLNVGICWTGNPRHRDNRRRSLPLEILQPLWDIPRCQFFSLQKEADTAGTPLLDLGANANLEDTAGLIDSLDVIVSIDSMIAHLAGALGRPLCLLLAATPDWRWGLAGERTRWYPSAHLFRQKQAGDWDSVIHRLSHFLINQADNHFNSEREPR